MEPNESNRHDRAGHNTVHLNAILDALLCESLREGRDRSVGRGHSREGGLRIERGIPGHENHGAFGLLQRIPCPNRQTTSTMGQ